MANHERVQLRNMQMSGAWQIFLDLVENCCQYAETEHWRLKPTEHSDSAIARNQAETRGQRLLFERFQAKMKLEMEALMRMEAPADPEDEIGEPTDEELLRPTPDSK